MAPGLGCVCVGAGLEEHDDAPSDGQDDDRWPDHGRSDRHDLAHGALTGALAVEVLSGREPVVRVLRAAAAHRELPVYLLSRQVRFVAVTQEAHRRIAARQLEQLETDRRIHEVFTQLTLEAAPVQRIVAEAGRLLGAEVVWWRRAAAPCSMRSRGRWAGSARRRLLAVSALPPWPC